MSRLPLTSRATDRASRRQLASRRRGTAALEAAIVLPVLILIMLAAVDLGRAMHAKDVLTNAVRVGAEYGATHRFSSDTKAAWESALFQVIQQEAGSIPSYNPSVFSATVTTTDLPGNDVQIRVEANYAFRTTVAWPFAPTPINLQHSVTMRQYQ